MFTENIDAGGRTPDGTVGYGFNVVHGQGESYVPESYADRTLASGALDLHIDDHTVVETDFSHYETDITGLPGSIVYFGKPNIVLPAGRQSGHARLWATRRGRGSHHQYRSRQDQARDINNSDFEIGGLYQDAVRNLFGITNTLTDNLGNYTVTKNFTAVPHFTVASNTASLNGRFDLFGFRNELTIGTNGLFNGQYSYVNSIATTLGTSNLADPAILPTQPIPNNGGQYKSAILFNQTIVTGDTFHFNEQWAVQAVASTSFLHSESFSKTGAVTSQNDADGVVIPTVSLIYKPVPKLTTYATFANSVEQGEQAPAGTANVNQFLAPYQDQEYEVGAKYAFTPGLLATFALFHMTRPARGNRSGLEHLRGSRHTTQQRRRVFFRRCSPDLSVFGGVNPHRCKALGHRCCGNRRQTCRRCPARQKRYCLRLSRNLSARFCVDGRLSCGGRTRRHQHEQFLCAALCDV